MILDKVFVRNILEVTVSIQNAIRLGKRSDKPRLLKVALNSTQNKAMILKNKLKLRSSNNPSPVRNVFITPDYTPLEQKKNKALHQQLADMNKIENAYTIKKWEDSAEITTLSVPHTDNHPLVDLPLANDSPTLTSLTVNCQSLLVKKESFFNLLNTYNPDIIFGTESWLRPDILSSEVFPADYSVYRRDCSDG